MPAKDDSIDNFVSYVEEVVSAPEAVAELARLDGDPAFQKSFAAMTDEQEDAVAKELGVMPMGADGSGEMTLSRYLTSYLLGEEMVNVRSAEGYDALAMVAGGSHPEMLRRAGRTEPCRLIKNLRSLQMSEYCTVPDDNDRPGLSVVSASQSLTAQQKSDAERILAREFFSVGDDENPNFAGFMNAAYSDFFDFDDITIHIRRTKSGRPLGLQLVDPTKVWRLVPPVVDRYRWDKKDYQAAMSAAGVTPRNEFRDAYRYAWGEKDQPVWKYTPRRMRKFHFYVSSHALSIGGFSIVSQAVRTITNVLQAVAMTGAQLSNNRALTGFLSISGLQAGPAGQLALQKFKKLMWAYMTGSTNAWRIPILSLPKEGTASWTPMRQSAREMEFYNWVSYLYTVLCQLTGTDPSEITLASNKASVGQRSFMEAGSGALMKTSQDRGLRTFLGYIERIVADLGVVPEITGCPDARMAFTGISIKDIRMESEVIERRLRSDWSLNRVLKQSGLPPSQEPWADVPGILSPTISQLWQLQQQQGGGSELPDFGEQPQQPEEGEDGAENGAPPIPGLGEGPNASGPGLKKAPEPGPVRANARAKKEAGAMGKSLTKTVTIRVVRERENDV